MKFDLLFEKVIRDYAFENTNNKAIFVFGRMNPPTAGHELLINHAHEIAEKENRELFVFISRSQDNKKNPLTHEQKLSILDSVFPEINFVVDPMANTPFNAGYWLRDHGFKNVKLVSGSDRVKEYTDRFKPYLNHKDPSKSFDFTRFKVEPIGAERDPDSDDVSGISSSKARFLAMNSNIEGFMQIMPADLPEDIARKTYEAIRSILSP